MSRRFKIIWFSIALLFGLFINETNLHYVKKNNPTNEFRNAQSTMYGYTLDSPDNSFYLPQIKNVLNGYGFTCDTTDVKFKVRRTPVYPLFYGAHYILFGEKFSFFYIRYTQLILNALGVVLLGIVVLNFTSNVRIAKWTVILYALSPFMVIYSYFTITESLYPFFTILTLFSFSYAVKTQKPLLYFIAGIVLGIQVLTRPVTGLLFPVLAIAIFSQESFFRNYKKKSIHLLILSLGLAIALAPWTIRNYFVTKGEIIALEKYYGEDPMEMGTGHIYFREWWKCWGQAEAENYNYDIRPFLKNDSLRALKRESYLSSLPEYAFIGTNKQELGNALLLLDSCYMAKYAGLYAERQDYFNLKTTNEFKRIIDRYKEIAPFRYYIITPLIVAKELLIHSNTHNFGSLNPPQRSFSIFQIIIKSIFYLLNIALIISFVVFCFNRKNSYNGLKWLVILFPLFTIFFFSYMARYAEVRYVLSAYPLFYFTLAFCIISIYNKNYNKISV